MGKTQETLQQSYSNLGESVFSPNARSFYEGDKAKHDCAHFTAQVYVCVEGNRLEGLIEGRAQYDGVRKMKPQKMDTRLHG